MTCSTIWLDVFVTTGTQYEKLYSPLKYYKSHLDYYNKIKTTHCHTETS